MIRTYGIAGALATAVILLSTLSAMAQDILPHRRITQWVDSRQLVTLRGNTHPQAKRANDRGALAGDFRLDHMLLQLQRAPEQEQALQGLIDQLHDPASPNYHHWLTAGEFGQKYGVAQADLDTVGRWLKSQGFQVNGIAPNHLLIDFSGSAAQVRSAFHTEIHQLDVNGEAHIANMTDPRIPAALSPVVHGVVSLHDFRAKPTFRAGSRSAARPSLTTGSGRQWVAPADLATIYNLNPLFNGGIAGQNQTIAVVNDSDLYSNADVATFRSVFGLTSRYGGSFTTIHPTGQTACADPGVAKNDSEATLDVEWAGAAAPAANIILASCTDTLTFGGEQIALMNLVNSANPPGVISMSYELCEPALGATGNYQVYSIAQQAAAEGISLFVSSGDASGASCDHRSSETGPAWYGLTVNGFASTPYNVAVGGTDFQDNSQGTAAYYWGAVNAANYGSALSYVPEIPWNDTCANSLNASWAGYSTPYGAGGYCDYWENYYQTLSASAQQSYAHYINPAGGGGGPSACATGATAIFDTVGGTCAGYRKPAWQAGVAGNPSDGVRDLPDVSLLAATGMWGHAYVFCFSDPSVNGSTSCAGDPSTWTTGGGTSFAAPAMAGIQALVNQFVGGPQGNPNAVYYKLAAASMSTTGMAACDASKGNAVAGSCIFHDVTAGDNDAPCNPNTPNCFAPSGTVGVLSTSTTAYQPAYQAAPGWDFATGLGSVNAYNLAMNWASAVPTYSLTVGLVGSGTVTSSPAGITCGTNCSATFGGGRTVTLTAVPAAGWTFVAWTGGCGGSGGCTLSLQGDTTVIPVFHQSSRPVLH